MNEIMIPIDKTRELIWRMSIKLKNDASLEESVTEIEKKISKLCCQIFTYSKYDAHLQDLVIELEIKISNLFSRLTTESKYDISPSVLTLLRLPDMEESEIEMRKKIDKLFSEMITYKHDDEIVIEMETKISEIIWQMSIKRQLDAYLNKGVIELDQNIRKHIWSEGPEVDEPLDENVRLLFRWMTPDSMNDVFLKESVAELEKKISGLFSRVITDCNNDANLTKSAKDMKKEIIGNISRITTNWCVFIGTEPKPDDSTTKTMRDRFKKFLEDVLIKLNLDGSKIHIEYFRRTIRLSIILPKYVTSKEFSVLEAEIRIFAYDYKFKVTRYPAILPINKPIKDVPTTNSLSSSDYYHQSYLAARRPVFIINSYFKGHRDERQGSEKDVERLVQTFTRFNMNCTVIEEPSAKTIKKLAIQHKTKNYEGYDFLMFVIMTHGQDNGTLKARDNYYNLDDDFINEILENSSLENIPKIFIIQACRGKWQYDYVYDNISKMKPADTLKIFSTYNGFISLRDIEEGTVFIQSFCDKLEELGETEDLESIIKKVMSVCVKQTKQVPEQCSTLLKRIFIGYIRQNGLEIRYGNCVIQ